MSEETVKVLKQSVRDYRIECFESLQFPSNWAEELADAKGANGHPLSWHAVKKVLDQGCTHKLAVKIFT